MGFWSWISRPCFGRCFMVGGHREMSFPIAGLLFLEPWPTVKSLLFFLGKETMKMTFYTLACLLLCAHLDKSKAEQKAMLSYTFQRRIEDKHRLNGQVNLHNRGKKIMSSTEGKLGQTDKRARCDWVPALLLADLRVKGVRTDKGKGKDCRLLADSFGPAWDS